VSNHVILAWHQAITKPSPRHHQAITKASSRYCVCQPFINALGYNHWALELGVGIGRWDMVTDYGH